VVQLGKLRAGCQPALFSIKKADYQSAAGWPACTTSTSLLDASSGS